MRLKGISNQGMKRLARIIQSQENIRFTHEELEATGKMDRDIPDYGPYELSSNSSGTPEGGNFIGGVIFGDGWEEEIDPWGLSSEEMLYFDEEEEEGLLGEQIEQIYTALIHATGVNSLISQGKTREEAEDMMEREFWGLGGLEMKDRSIVYIEE